MIPIIGKGSLVVSGQAPAILLEGRPRGDLVFFANGERLLTMHGDGRITIGAVESDAVAKMFLDTLAQAFPAWLEKMRQPEPQPEPQEKS